MRLLVCLLTICLLCGCNRESLIEKLSSSEDTATARHYLDQIHAHDFAAIERDIDPSIKSAGFEQVLEQMSAMTPAGEPTSVKVVGSQTFDSPGERKVNTTFEYAYGDKLFIENLAVLDKNGTKTVIGLHVIPETKSLEEQNKFTFVGKTFAQYLILVLAVLAVSITLFSLVSCVQTKGLRRKWLWIIFILFGFGALSVNWTTGQLGLRLLIIQLLSASATAQFYSPWIVSASAPVGAIVFLVKSKWRGSIGRRQAA